MTAGEILMATAPELLEADVRAAKLLRQYVHSDEPVPMEEFEKALFLLETAIAKATP